LRAQGYSCWTLRQYESATASFCAAIEKRELGSGQLDGVTTDRLQRSVVGAIPEYDRKWGKFCIRRFIDHLAEAGVAAVPHPPTHRLTARQRLHQEYEAYLRQQRGLAEGTIRNSLYYGERFLSFRFGEKLGDLKAITPEDIVAFLCKLKAGSRARRCKALPSRLRSRSCSGAARPGVISLRACRASLRPRTICHAISSPERSNGCSQRYEVRMPVGGATTRCCC
jgi:hypothetical protein